MAIMWLCVAINLGVGVLDLVRGQWAQAGLSWMFAALLTGYGLLVDVARQALEAWRTAGEASTATSKLNAELGARMIAAMQASGHLSDEDRVQ